jgi:hypothetical protein
VAAAKQMQLEPQMLASAKHDVAQLPTSSMQVCDPGQGWLTESQGAHVLLSHTPGHDWQASPPVPHSRWSVPAWQEPASSQQPFGQLVPSHVHTPPTQCWPLGQTTAVPTHTPLWQVSLCVQAFPFSQGVPFGSATQRPSALQLWQGGQGPAAEHGAA